MRATFRVTSKSLFVVLAIVGATLPARAQPPAGKPKVYVRQVRVDSLLLAFGADSDRIRSVVLDALRKAGRLASEPGSALSALDINVTALRTAYGGTLEPHGYVRIEVGRNLMEEGRAQRLQWDGHQDLPPSPTFRDLGRSVLPTVLKVVHDYLLGRRNGA